MPQPEHEDGLQIITNIQDGTQNACFNPRKLSLPVIRRMLTSQIQDKDSNVCIWIEAGHETAYISPDRMHQIRELPPKQLELFIETHTQIIGNADTVIFLGCEN